MVESVGQQLQQARLRRKVSVEYAAKATRIRPERIVDLEKDDYTNFPNLAYAKGFLIIYAKYLDVDISEFVRAFETGNPVSIRDYEYLSNPPDPFPRTQSYETGGRGRAHGGGGNGGGGWGGPSIGTIFIAILLLLFAGALVLYFWVSAQRLGMARSPDNASPVADVQPTAKSGSDALRPEAPAATPSPTPPETAGIPYNATGTEAVETAGVQTTGNPEASGTVTGTAQPATAGVAPSPAASAPSPAAVSPHKIEIRPLKKTWVVIRQGPPTAPPIFQDYLYPQAKPLEFSGNDFFIQVRDENAVEIRKDGEPVPYQAPGVTIP